MTDLFSSLFLVAGGFFALVAGLGVLRFPDLLSRMHASTKASGAALSLILFAFFLRLPGWEVGVKALVSLGLAFLTLPVAAHMLGRTARSGNPAKEAPSSEETEQG